MKILVETQNLQKVYKTNGVIVEALRGVNLEVKSGEFVIVMGPSGCGKSTLLHLLAGLDLPSEGQINVAGRRIDLLTESARAILRRETIGFVFQAFNLVPNLTVAENIEMPALLANFSSIEAASRMEHLLESLDISEKAEAYPGELSGGEQQRVAIARALVNKPLVLLVDEPTGNLDTRSGCEVMKLLRHFHSDGQTIILVTHDPKVASFAERVIFMRDGQLVDQVELTPQGGSNLILSHLVTLEV